MKREVRDIRKVGSVFSHWLNTEPRWRNRKGSHQLGLMHQCIMEPSYECWASINILWVWGSQITRSLFPSIFLTSDLYERRSPVITVHLTQCSKLHTAAQRTTADPPQSGRWLSIVCARSSVCVCMYVCDRFIGVIYPAQWASVVRNGGLSARRSLLLCSLYGLH